jgi:hypothetical protein
MRPPAQLGPLNGVRRLRSTAMVRCPAWGWDALVAWRSRARSEPARVINVHPAPESNPTLSMAASQVSKFECQSPVARQPDVNAGRVRDGFQGKVGGALEGRASQ